MRSRNKQRQAVAPCHSTAAPSSCASTSTSLSLRLSTSRSPQLQTVTDGWVCDPVVSALHFSYALTQEEEEDAESETDRCQLQSPRPLHTPADSPVSFFKLDATATAATEPVVYRRVNNNTAKTATHGTVEPQLSPVGGGSGGGRTRDWLQSSIGRLAFRRRGTAQMGSAPARPSSGHPS